MPSSFAELGVPAPLCATLARRGINEPFPIQAATLPDVLAGRDVAGKAPTGSGKTIAFGLAIAQQATTAGPVKPRRPRALVLVPTRELAAQVQRELSALIDERRHGAVVSIYGGVGYGPQRRMLARGVSAVVACPGRLEDLVGTGDVVLDRAELVVLDEADRMADMGFMPAVRRLLDQTPERRQTLLFSATLDGDVDKLVRHYQRDPIRHDVAGGEDDSAEVDHLFWKVPREKRVALTADIVNRTGSAIVFTRTRHGADRVARQLGQAGVKAVPIHGRRSQVQRDQALAQFTKGRAPALVATDVAARGIHVDGVGCVVHFDMADDPKDYVHRSGRTGRAGATGVVVSLVVDDGHKAMRALQRQVGRTEPFTDPDLGLLAGSPAIAGPGHAPEPSSGPGVAAGTASSPEAGSAPAPLGGAHDGRNVSPGEGTGQTEVGRARPRPGRRERRNVRTERSDRDARRPGDRTDRTRRGERGDRGGRDGYEHGRAGGHVSGTVASYDPDRGFGFISRRGGSDVFVHVSALAGNQALEAGQRVRFELAPGRRGQQARNVQPVS
jgi:superfamily II DNA/RNA helicase/cold shock CspA family protein